MYTTPEQLSAAGKAGLESVLPFATTALGSVERLTAFNLNTARSMMEYNTANAKALMAAKTPEEFASLQAGMAKPFLEKAMSYSRGLYEIYSDTSDEFAKLTEARIASLNKEISVAVDKAASGAPVGSEQAVAAFRSAVAAANNVYDTVSKAAKQAVELVEANVGAAADATLKAVSTAAPAPKAKKAA